MSIKASEYHRALLTKYLADQAAGVPSTISSTYSGTLALQDLIKVTRERLRLAGLAGN